MRRGLPRSRGRNRLAYFATESHFCREFKKVFGTSPQSFAPARDVSLKLSLLDHMEGANLAARF